MAKKATLEGVRSVLAALGHDVEAAEGPRPPPSCAECGAPLTSDVRRLGCCDPCLRKRVTKDRIARLKAVWNQVPEEFRWASFSSPHLRSRVNVDEQAIELLKDSHRSVLLYGPSGSGKTSLAVAKLRAVLSKAQESGAAVVSVSADFKRGLGAMFVRSWDLPKAAAGHRLGRGRPPLIERALSASVLVLDELGTDAELYRGSAVMREVLLERHDARRQTIVTTYLDPEALAALYGHGIARRIEQSSLCFDLTPKDETP